MKIRSGQFVMRFFLPLCVSVAIGAFGDAQQRDDLSGLQAFLLEQRTKTEGMDLRFDGEDRLPEVRVDGKPARIHTQGLYVTAQHYYVTGRLESEPRRPLLVRFDRRQTERVESIDLASALRKEAPEIDQLDHPGGFDFDGDRFWIPLSESRPHGKTVVLTYRPTAGSSLSSQQAEVAFTVDDHIGAIAYDRSANLLYGANWDTRVIYGWKPDGEEIRKIPASALMADSPTPALAVQDWKSIGDGLILASGMDKSPLRRVGASSAVLATIDIKARAYRAYQRLRPPPSHDVRLTHEGMAVLDGAIYFLPNDLGRGATVFRYQWHRKADRRE